MYEKRGKHDLQKTKKCTLKSELFACEQNLKSKMQKIQFFTVFFNFVYLAGWLIKKKDLEFAEVLGDGEFGGLFCLHKFVNMI